MGIDAVLELVIRILLAIAMVSFVMTFLIYPLVNVFTPFLYMLFPYSGFDVVYHVLRAFVFMLGLWALSKVLA